jgi:prepilin peptidase CpaA
MNTELILGADALIIALIAAVIDVRQHRIPNWLTYPGIVMGIALRSGLLGWRGLLSSVLGCVLAGGIVFLFYMVRAMGAGDVKLLAAIGSLLGPSDALVVLVATALAGGVLAIVYVVLRRRLGATLKNVNSVLIFHSWSGLKAHPELNLDNPSALRMPYGLAIATGTLYTFLMMWWR